MSAGTAYSKRYAGGFVNLPTQTTAIDSTFLNAVETALLQLIGAAPTADAQVMQWDNANTRYGPALLLNKNVDPAAAIAKSKIDLTGANAIVNADIAGAAAIARSKLDFGSGLVNADIAAAAAIAASKLSGYPTDGSKLLRGDGSWVGASKYRKVTSKTVTNSVAATDLLNGEITIAASEMTATGILRLKAWGTVVNNTGATQNSNIFSLVLGGTTLLATGALAAVWAANATANPWVIECIIQAQNATNAQFSHMRADGFMVSAGAATTLFSSGSGLIEQRAAIGGYSYWNAQGYNTSAIDMTSARALVLNVTQPVASANYTTVLQGATVEIL